VRVLAAAAVVCLWLTTAGVAAGDSYSSPAVGFGSGFSTTSETTGYGNADTSQCTAGMQTIGHVIYARCAIEFDVSLIPGSAVVSSAVLSVHSSSVPACVSSGCDIAVYGYAGDAGFSIADLTAGAYVGILNQTGVGKTSTVSITNHVQAILDSGAGVPIVGVALGRFIGNPAEDRTVISNFVSADPPSLVVTYSLPGSPSPSTSATQTIAPAKTPKPTVAPTRTPATTPAPPPTASPAASVPAGVVTSPAAPTPTPRPTPTPTLGPPVAAIGGNRADWLPPLGILVIVVFGLGGLLALRRRGHKTRNPYLSTTGLTTDSTGPTDPYIPTDPHRAGSSAIPTEPHYPGEPHYPQDPHYPGDPHYPTDPHSPTEPLYPTEPHFPTDPHIPSDPH
jgi:hypothetical protein